MRLRIMTNKSFLLDKTINIYCNCKKYCISIYGYSARKIYKNNSNFIPDKLLLVTHYHNTRRS